MPLDAQHGWRRTDMVTAGEILARLSAEFSLTPDAPDGRGSAPRRDIPGRWRPRPRRCDRLGHPAVLRNMRPGRLTADGQIRNCLFATTETDQRTPLRAGASDDQLAAAWRGAATTKLPGHGISESLCGLDRER